MVFSSIPAYLDPSNWHQQQNHQIIGSSSSNPLFPPPPPPPPPPHGGGGSIRPGSMSERARLANIPMPETALKCPRCESTNTKFCYFNNYSLSQPRHFCKTCRRYWTRGGALRNVPVGGGCRRNKRSKSSSSKSPASSQTNPSTSANNTTIPTNGGGGGSANNLLNLAPQFPPLRFTSSDLTDNNFNGDHMGLNNYSGTVEPLLLGANGGGGVGALLSSDVVSGNNNNNIEQWRLHQIQQFPFLGGLDTSSSSPGIYQFHGGGESGINMGGGVQMGHNHNHVRPKFSSSMLSHVGSSVKMEENHPELNLSRQLLGGMQGNDQWNNNNNNNNNGNGANWTELSSFSSSSTSNPL